MDIGEIRKTNTPSQCFAEFKDVLQRWTAAPSPGVWLIEEAYVVFLTAWKHSFVLHIHTDGNPLFYGASQQCVSIFWYIKSVEFSPFVRMPVSLLFHLATGDNWPNEKKSNLRWCVWCVGPTHGTWLWIWPLLFYFDLAFAIDNHTSLALGIDCNLNVGSSLVYSSPKGWPWTPSWSSLVFGLGLGLHCTMLSSLFVLPLTVAYHYCLPLTFQSALATPSAVK